MAIGKNKKTGKGSKKKQKVDAFARKEWYRIRAPRPFTNRDMGWTCVNKSAGNKIASDSLKGRVFEFHLGDLKRPGNALADYHKQFQYDGKVSRKMKLLCEEVKNNDCYTNFTGMSMTTEELRSSIKKWATLIEAHEDARTTDGYLLRVFVMALTTEPERSVQVKKTHYAKSSQVREIRRKMSDTIKNEISQCTLEQVVDKLIPNAIGDTIKKACFNTFPLNPVNIRKVKVIKRPIQDYTKIMALHESEKEMDEDAIMDGDAAPEEDYTP